MINRVENVILCSEVDAYRHESEDVVYEWKAKRANIHNRGMRLYHPGNCQYIWKNSRSNCLWMIGQMFFKSL